MKKLQDESDLKHHRKDSQSTKAFQKEQKSPNFIEAGFDRLESLKKDYTNEVEILRSLLFKQTNSSPRDTDFFKACQTSVNSSVLKLKEKLFTIEEL